MLNTNEQGIESPEWQNLAGHFALRLLSIASNKHIGFFSKHKMKPLCAIVLCQEEGRCNSRIHRISLVWGI